MLRQIREAMSTVLGTRTSNDNRIDVLRNGDEIFPAMLEAIRAARRSVDFLTFVYWTGDVAKGFAGALSDRARAGVDVRVLLDAWGSRPMDRDLLAQMRDAGCDVRLFRELARWRVWTNKHRTHRKVLICDEQVGFTGGVGIAREWEGNARSPDEWRDTHFRIQGPAVSSLRSSFLTNWIEDTGIVPDHDMRDPEEPTPAGDVPLHVVRGQASVGWSDIAVALRAFIKTARERIDITTAYFVPDGDLSDLLRETARRGVEVRILLPGVHIAVPFVRIASHDDYAELLEAGIQIWEYQQTILHAKILTVDDRAALVGSANFNHRSLEHDDELAVLIYDSAIAKELARHFAEDLERSERVDGEDWKERPLLSRTLELATRPVRRWF